VWRAFLKRGLPVFPGGHTVGVGHGEMPAFERAGQLETWLDVELHTGICGSDDDEPVSEQAFARSRLNEIALLQVIHPVEIGRDEHVGRRAAFDLFGERRTCRIGNFYDVAALSGHRRVSHHQAFLSGLPPADNEHVTDCSRCCAPQRKAALTDTL